jgi:hypothetical protein
LGAATPAPAIGAQEVHQAAQRAGAHHRVWVEHQQCERLTLFHHGAQPAVVAAPMPRFSAAMSWVPGN